MKKTNKSQSAFFKLRIAASLLLCCLGATFALFAFSRGAHAQSDESIGKSHVLEARYMGMPQVIHFDISPALRDIKPVDPSFSTRKEENEDREVVPIRWRFVPEIDQLAQTTNAPTPLISDPIVSFNGQPNSASVSPPDPNMAVGPNHVVAMANLAFQVFNKSGTSLFGPAASNTIWAGFGGDCQTRNDGDPVVIYDQLADRWLLTQFTAGSAPFLNCVALSVTNDPTGQYYRWSIATTNNGANFPDYPKWGMMPNAYFASTREFLGTAGAFQGVGAYALNRAQALAGNPSPQVIAFLAPPSPSYNVGDGLLPADLDGTTPPPAGRPEYFLGSMDNNGPYGAPQDALTLWKFTVDFATPANSSFVLANTIPTAPFNSILGLCGGGRACIPQPSTTNRLDHLGYRQRPLFRLAYRNFGTHESLVTNQSVSAGTGPSGEVSGIRWWELRSPNSSPVIFQEGTYAPGLTDGIHRWMGSIAMNGAGDMALGYSASSATLFPSVYYTGRNAASALGQMPLGEAAIITGTGSQTGSNRWGDYSALDVDPVDDATFWYVNEWVPSTSSVGWQLRIGSFKTLPSPAISNAGITILSESCSPTNGVPDPGEMVTLNVCARNDGSLPSSGTIGTLAASGGVTNPSGPVNFGSIPIGATVCKPFTFTASGTCGGSITASFQFTDNGSPIGSASYTSVIGGSAIAFSENFDGVTAPALPTGWTADQGTNGASSPLWVTSSAGTPTPAAFSAPNSAFTPDPGSLLDNRLYSPVVTYGSGDALTFRHNMDLEQSSATVAYDAGVLEMSVGGGAWTDIVTAGGTFTAGGYNHTSISTGFSNPLLPSRPNWSGTTSGFVEVNVTLPPSAAGQPVQFRWRMGSDSSVSRTGWRVDNVAISHPVCASSCAPTPSGAVSRMSHLGNNFDIPLPLSGTPGIECRRINATNDHTIVMTFPASVSVTGTPQAQVISGSATVGSGGVANGGAVTVSGSTISVPITNVGNAQTIYVAINGVTSGGNSGTEVVPMSVLLGDTSGDGTVNSADLTQTRGRSGQPLTTATFRSDVNVDGAINSADATLVRNASGTSLP